MQKEPHKYKVNENTATVYGARKNGARFAFTVDVCDLPRVLSMRWAMLPRKNEPRGGYLVSSYMKNGKQRKVYLHHFLIGTPTGGRVVDHADKKTMNNTRDNLRIVTISINNMNRRITNKHGFPGLSYYIRKNGIKMWVVRLRIKDMRVKTINTCGKSGTRLLHIGVFKTKQDAIEARRLAEQKYFGVICH